ncbi:hypothetical protein ELD05_13135 [Caldicellulosiruptor changbaiensis]|uniref:Nucleotidyl transferase AbiEii/AbiGii toxin family protein n=1 Tax=Caldicellulosiruptor changbaiensis TaxID=1222016 RepID=A0A3T0D981_9FIRM|nr:nucleotidyl transferase AbiEii/AbiGii toxin family protein [Caldicellulosiruptor changbaiensis]AZT91469.1 hypothetical protein ELD05_13135 [Caldicellulosiruptor changbaiensis]
MDMEILDPEGYEICRNIAKSNLAKKFYLAGGTALALQLRHRKSYDLDFFQKEVSEKIEFEYIYNVLTQYFSKKDVNIVVKQVDQMTSTICRVKVSFIAHPFPLIEPLVQGDKIDIRLKGIELASPKEIALMKAYTIGRRPTFRDYIDLYFLLKKGIVTLEYILEKAPQKFVIEGEPVFSKKLFLEQLMYTDDLIDKETALISVIGEAPNVDEIESFLTLQVKTAIEKYIKKRGMLL